MVQRMFGLSGSGMDIDSMVKQLMQAKRTQYSYLYQNRDLLVWKKQAYNDMYKAANTFATTLTSYKLSSALSIKNVSSSNTNVATATANADAANISHDLSVDGLAVGVKSASASSITTGASKDTIANQFYGGTSPGNFDVKLSDGKNTATITVDPTKSIYEFVNQINSSNLNVTANYDFTLDRFFINTNNTGATTTLDFSGSSAAGANFIAGKLKLATGSVVSENGVTSTSAFAADASKTVASQFGLAAGTTFNLKINGTQVAIDGDTDTLNDVIAKINTAAGSSVASYTDGKFSLQPGSGNIIDLVGSDATAMSFLTNNLKLNTANVKGKDAQFTLDGVALTQSSNTFSISGVKYNLASTGSTTIGVSSDTDKIVTSIKNFVEQYNTLLDTVNDKLTEKRDYDYKPLTSDQKASMSQADIDAWQKKAKTGILHSDTIMSKLVNNMRNALSGTVAGLNGKYNSASAIGITSGDQSERGHLYLDEDALKKALTEDPDAVLKVFGTSGKATDNQNGIVARLNKVIDSAKTDMLSSAGLTDGVDSSAFGKTLRSMNTKISDTETRLKTYETNYYNQFSQMETYIQKMNSQSSWLSQQFK